jgi:hypothetical protein
MRWNHWMGRQETVGRRTTIAAAAVAALVLVVPATNYNYAADSGHRAGELGANRRPGVRRAGRAGIRAID